MYLVKFDIRQPRISVLTKSRMKGIHAWTYIHEFLASLVELGYSAFFISHKPHPRDSRGPNTRKCCLNAGQPVRECVIMFTFTKEDMSSTVAPGCLIAKMSWQVHQIRRPLTKPCVSTVSIAHLRGQDAIQLYCNLWSPFRTWNLQRDS